MQQKYKDEVYVALHIKVSHIKTVNQKYSATVSSY